MSKRCIYCDDSKELSKSDIIPDALTNAKIINGNVCRVEHNNKFSDLFESEVISKLALVTNELDVRSSKSGKYAMYSAQVNVAGRDYNTKISSEADLFRNKTMRSVDGKTLLGPIETIKQIRSANDKNVSEIDVNQLETEKKVNFDASVFFSSSMFRMAAKIAYEWYCLSNNVNGKLSSFEPIIQYIVNGVGEDIVSIVSNTELYDIIESNVNFGSHVLLSYIAKDNSVNILLSLFGIAIYNVRVCDSVIDSCENNVLFLELTLDAGRSSFKFSSFDEFSRIFIDGFTNQGEINGVTCLVPKDMTDTTLKYKLMYYYQYGSFQHDLRCIYNPNNDFVKFIIHNVEKVLQSSAVTFRGLKRFVKEHIKDLNKEIKLNPKATDRKSIFMYYLMLIIGQSDSSIKGMSDLNKILKAKFHGETIDLSNTLSEKLKNEIMSTNAYSEMIIKGAKVIQEWDY